MSTTDPNNQPVPDPSPQPAPPSTPASDPETISVNRAEYDALQEQLAQARATFDVLNPHASRIERLIRNDRAGELFDNAWNAYEGIQARNEPQVPDNVKPLYDEVKRIGKYVDDYETARKSELERPQREYDARKQEWINSPANNRFFQKMQADHPKMKKYDVERLAAIAFENDFEPLESVYRREAWHFANQQTPAPPSSQRADAGEIGSAPSPNGQGGPTMRDRIIELERARRGMTA